MKLLFILIFSLVSSASFAQANNKLIWEENRKLTWEDFQGEPSNVIPFHANTSSGISYSWGLKGALNKFELTYNVESFFIIDQSWVKSEYESEHLLKHEQLHFDISELFARKLREKLSKVDNSKLSKNSSDQLNKLYEDIAAERGLMQEQFDKETNHGSIKEAELKWQLQVAEALTKLASFRN